MILQSCTVNRPTLLVWDDEGEPPKGEWISVLWRGFAGGNDFNVISIPKLIEEHSDALRSQYLAWIYELGEARIKGERVVDHLELRPGFSNWWMTLLMQKSNAFVSPHILEAFKFFVLEKTILKRKKNDFILLISSNKAIALILRGYCQNAGIKFEWKRTSKVNNSQAWVESFCRLLPYPIQAGIFFVKFLWVRLSFGGQKRAQVLAPFTEVTFVDILVHIDKQALSVGHFSSNYWTALVGALKFSGVNSHWLHSYYEYRDVTSQKQAQGLISCFNECADGRQDHVLIDADLSPCVLLRALQDYFRLLWKSFRLTKIRSCFRPKGSSLDFWVLFKRDWYNSMRGSSALSNCLRLSLFEKVLRRLPRQRVGVYIQENQPWEMALIYAWKTAGHGRLIGVPHATVRYWDLRYFYDPRSYQCKKNNDLPMPDQVAVNGPVALRTYLKDGYPGDQIVEVEALRYLHLAKDSKASVLIEGDIGILRVLICGGIMPTTNSQMMSWLENAARDLPPATRYIVKPHPACAINSSDYPSLTLEVTDAPLFELFADCDVVFTSNSTSAAVDAYCSGIPVVHILDGNTFNMSPLRGVPGTVYITDPTKLADALQGAKQGKIYVAKPYFCLDRELPRWRKLLNTHLETSSVRAGYDKRS